MPAKSLEHEYPACKYVEAAQRRRLTPLARIALHLAQECSADLPNVRVVFASRHGEVNRTHLMLQDIANEQQVSPTVFGTSVHNAVVGVLSLLRQDRSAATAIAAGESTFIHGLLQAVVDLVAEPDAPVLFIYADLPLLPFYDGADDACVTPLGLALLLQSASHGWQLMQDDTAQCPADWMPPMWLAHELAHQRCDIPLAGWRLVHAHVP